MVEFSVPEVSFSKLGTMIDSGASERETFNGAASLLSRL